MLRFINTSTRPTRTIPLGSTTFQSRFGFSGRRNCRDLRSDRLDNPPDVSIPSWIFWSSQRALRSVDPLGQDEFQFRLGFSGRRNVPITSNEPTISVSIPSWIFWSSQPENPIDQHRRQWLFQFRLGFSGRRNVAYNHVEPAVCVVSIPSWIFWSSQHRIESWIVHRAFGFNSVLDFLVVATTPRAR